MTEQQTVETEQQTVATAPTFDDLTPYAAMKVLNVLLKRAGLDFKVSSQAMYSRAIKGTIRSYRLLEDGTRDETRENGTWMFEGNSFAQWAKQYVSSYVNGTTMNRKADYESLADKYSL